MEEVSFGEFARRSRLSIKALRLYDERGVLVPARVDQVSGYRYFELARLETARGIAMLRQLDLSLPEIKELLAWIQSKPQTRSRHTGERPSLLTTRAAISPTTSLIDHVERGLSCTKSPYEIRPSANCSA